MHNHHARADDLAAKPCHDVHGAHVYNQIFFTNVLRIIDDQQITKYELADQAGISISFLSDLTNGKANPSLKVMEAIAAALATPLPALLENTDLDSASLKSLAGREVTPSLPQGYVRTYAVLTEYQAFTVQQWDDKNRREIGAQKK